MYRGIVEHIAPDDVFSQALHQTNEVDVFALSGITKAEARATKYYTLIRFHKAPGVARRSGLLVDKNIYLAKGDIIDFYIGKTNDEAMRRKNKIKVPGIAWAFGVPYITDAFYIPADEPGKFLGIVCRAADDGCRYNSSPETQIGIGRKMIDGNDYRGAVAESKQKILVPDINFAEFWSIPACFTCGDDPTE